MLEAHGRLIGLGLAEIPGLQSIEIIPVHMTSNAPDGRDIADGRFRKRLATRCVADRVKIWKTAIGQFVRFEMIICERKLRRTVRSEEHTSELQSLMRISYDVCSLKNK